MWNALITVLALPSVLTPLFRKEKKKKIRTGKQTKNPLELLCLAASVELQSLEKDCGGGGEGQDKGRGEDIHGLFDGFL